MEYEHMSAQLTTTRPAALSRAQKDALWGEIEKGIRTPAVVSPYYPTFLRTRTTMTAFMIALMLMLGAGGTAVAANDARPGDILFSIDQTLEDVRLALASSDESRASLKIKYAEERLGELRSILAEQEGGVATTTASSSVTVRTFEAEADVFTDTTIVKVEINDRTTTFVTTADTKDEVIDEIVRRYSVDRSTVAAALDFEIEDRASRVLDLRGTDTDDAKRVAMSVGLIETLLNDGVDDTARAQIYTQLVRALTNNDDNDDTEVRIDDDGDRIEIRSGDDRIEIREKDGETEVRMKRDDDDSSEDDDRSSDDGNSNSSSFEAEADVFTDTTIVKVEINDRTTTFVTTADTKDEVIDEIVRRYSVDRSTVAAALDFEIEDRASRVGDDNNDERSYDGDDNRGNDNNVDDRNDDDDSNDSSDDSDGRIKIEVRVEEGRAEVRVENGGNRLEYETTYTSESQIVADIAARSGFSAADVRSNLDLEVKD